MQNFMAQIASLQSEIRMLAKSQVDAADMIQKQEAELSKERKLNEDLKKKYQVAYYPEFLTWLPGY